MIHEEYTNNFISTKPRRCRKEREILFENNLIKSHSFTEYSCFMMVRNMCVVFGITFTLFCTFFRIHWRKPSHEVFIKTPVRQWKDRCFVLDMKGTFSAWRVWESLREYSWLSHDTIDLFIPQSTLEKKIQGPETIEVLRKPFALLHLEFPLSPQQKNSFFCIIKNVKKNNN